MSAQIPSTMRMKDLLKPSGYDCPEELLDKTFEEATSGGDTKISTNTAAIVDASQYTEPVEITPAEGYDATKKVTLNLTNIPSGGVNKLYGWENTEESTAYFTAVENPAVGGKAYARGQYLGNTFTGDSISVVTEDTITVQDMVFTRQSSIDIDPVWE